MASPHLLATDTVQPMRLASYQRDKLSEILYTYNQERGADDATLRNCQKLKEASSFCVVTGQQLGLCAGPSYTILKAISCLLLAKEKGAIPIFWAATEDHDVEEIRRAIFVDEGGNLKRFRLQFKSSHCFVEDLMLTEQDKKELAALFSYVGFPLKETYLFNSYARGQISFLEDLFRGTGLVFLEPYLLRPLACEFFAFEREKAREIQTILNKSNEETSLFKKNETGERVRLHIDDKEEIPLENLSTDVFARPLLQCKIIPTLAYVAGPNELEYLRKLRSYFAFHGIPMPHLVPRISATFIPKKIATFLRQLSLSPWDTLPSKDEYEEKWKGTGLPYSALHQIQGTLFPKNERQERVLNWLGFQKETTENLVQACLAAWDWKERGHYYGFF